MTTFICTNNGTYINSSRVRKLEPGSNKHGVAVLMAYVENEGIFECPASVENELVPVIPAVPGFFQLAMWFPDDKLETPADYDAWINRDVIIAWRMTSWPTPVTVDGSDDWKSAPVLGVLDPSGKVTLQGDRSFENYDAFLRSLPKAHEDHIERQAKRAARAKAKGEAA